MNIFWIVILILLALAMSFVILKVLRGKRYNAWPDAIILIFLVFLIWGLSEPQPILPLVASKLYSTRTPTLTATPTEVTNPTSTPPTETIYLKIPVNEVLQFDGTNYNIASRSTNGAKMILIFKETRTATDGSTLSMHKSAEFCLEVVSFLKTDNTRTNDYNEKDTPNLLVVMDEQDVARYGRSIPNIEEIYFIPDATCTKFSTQTPTPTATPIP